jgi:hypothetical protein
MLLFALLVLVVLVESAVSGVLTKFREVNIEVAIHKQARLFGLDEDSIKNHHKQARLFGLDEDSIKNHVLVWLRSKVPRLVVNESAVPHIQTQFNLNEIGGLVFGSVGIEIVRQVTIKENDEDALACVWRTGFIIHSSLDSTRARALEFLDRSLTQFAADWYRDNP